MAIANSSRIVLGLPHLPEGVPPQIFSQLYAVYQAINNLTRQISQLAGIDPQPADIWNQLTVDDTIWQIVPTRWYVQQFEALSFGQCVAAVLDAGVLKVRKANATNNTKPAIGFVTSTTHTSAAGQFCEVTVGVGLITGVSGMTSGRRYFLSTTDGLITDVAPNATGNIVQVVGVALASNRLLMNINQDWRQL